MQLLMGVLVPDSEHAEASVETSEASEMSLSTSSLPAQMLEWSGWHKREEAGTDFRRGST
jgi:hypothetical protein